MRVDLLVVEKETRIVEPLADFSRLPFTDGRRDRNPGRPFLSESIMGKCFEDASAWLPTGVHLHWTLPAALTSGRHRRGVNEPVEDHEGRVLSLDFTRIPNRWLVRTPTDWWVVESDYLHPEGVDASHLGVPFLLPKEDRIRLGGSAPFRYLGRRVRLVDWTPYDASAEYLSSLTAIGWGDPSFHALFPNCWSVLGFHDPATADGASPSGVEATTDDGKSSNSDDYQVFGFYADLSTDPLAALVRAAQKESQEMTAEAAEEAARMEEEERAEEEARAAAEAAAAAVTAGKN